MKRYIILISSMLFAAACSNEECGSAQEGESVTISISASVADNFTRANADETVVADRCILEIYNADGTPYDNKRIVSTADASGKFNFEPKILSGRSYKFVFWADKSGATADDDLHYDTSNGLRDIAAVTTGLTACDMEYDAFFATADVISDKSQSLSATLRRAVCRINVATGFVPAQTGSHTVDVAFADAPARFDALTGSVSGAEAATSTSTVEIASAGTQLEWYTYLFAPAEAGSRTVNFDMTATAPDGSDAEFSYEFRDIPVQRNYRVNVSVGKQAGLAVNLSAE